MPIPFGFEQYPNQMPPDLQKQAFIASLLAGSNSLLQPTPYKQRFGTALSNALMQYQNAMGAQEGAYQQQAMEKALRDAQIAHLNAQTQALGQPKPATIAEQIATLKFNQEQSDRQRDESLRPGLTELMGMSKEAKESKYPSGSTQQDAIMQLIGQSPNLTKEALAYQRSQQEANPPDATTKTINSYAEAMFGKSWDSLSQQQKMAVMDKYGLQNPMAVRSVGPPIYNVVPTAEGLQPFNARTGQVKGAPIGDKPMSNEMITAEQQLGTLKETMDRVKTLYKADYVGPAAGRIAGIKEITVGVPAEQANFNADVAQMQNTLVYLMSGKQINEQEYTRLKRQLPDKNLPPSVFQARMKNFDDTLNSIIENRHKMSGGYGVGTQKQQGGAKADPLGLR